MKENTKETNIAYYTTKFILLLQKQKLRKISLEATTKVRLINMIFNAEDEKRWTVTQLHQMNKSYLVQLIIDMEGTKQAIQEYETQLQEMNVNTVFIEQIESYGV